MSLTINQTNLAVLAALNTDLHWITTNKPQFEYSKSLKGWFSPHEVSVEKIRIVVQESIKNYMLYEKTEVKDLLSKAIENISKLSAKYSIGKIVDKSEAFLTLHAEVQGLFEKALIPGERFKFRISEGKNSLKKSQGVDLPKGELVVLESVGTKEESEKNAVIVWQKSPSPQTERASLVLKQILKNQSKQPLSKTVQIHLAEAALRFVFKNDKPVAMHLSGSFANTALQTALAATTTNNKPGKLKEEQLKLLICSKPA